jgi:hypothetical protein
MNSQSILQAITDKVHDLIMFQGLDRDAAEARAISEVAKEYQLAPTSIPDLPKATSARSRAVDSQTKIDADFVRARLLEPLGVEITGIYAEGDIADFTDEQLEQLVKDWGFGA